MAVIKITSFGGVMPSTLPRNLPADAAQTAENLQPQTTEFRPISEDATVATVPYSNPGSIYRSSRNVDGTLNANQSTGWRASIMAINRVRAQVDDNLTDRNYYTVAGGSQPPRVGDITGADRQLGVPAPLTAPNCTVSETFTFTPEMRTQEIKAALQKATTDVLNGPVAGEIVGFEAGSTNTGWISVADFAPSSPNADKDVWRVIAVDPATKSIISTYTNGKMSVDEAGWLLDPSLGGEYLELPAGKTAPSWAAGHTMWWGIRFRTKAHIYQVDQAAAKTALDAIDLPGSQGAEKWLSSAESTEISVRIHSLLDADDPAVKDKVSALLNTQAVVGNLFNGAGSQTAKMTLAEFYAQSDVANAINDAKAVCVDILYSTAVQLGQVAPWENDGG